MAHYSYETNADEDVALAAALIDYNLTSGSPAVDEDEFFSLVVSGAISYYIRKYTVTAVELDSTTLQAIARKFNVQARSKPNGAPDLEALVADIETAAGK